MKRTPRTPPQLLLVLCGSLLLGGCAADRFTEADEGQTKVVARGATFSISLASNPAAAPRETLVEGALIRLVSHRSDLEAHRDIYQFVAEGLGEADIRIRPSGSPPGTVPDYVLRVRVEQGSKEWSSQPLQQTPRSNY
jgi:hypothetical protein